MTFSAGGHTLAVPIAMFLWPLLVAALFLQLRPQRAVLWSFILGFLFLPEGAYLIRGLPEYSKFTATTFCVLAGALAMDGGRMFRLRFHWADLPMAVWCFGRFATSLSNGLGVYDGVANSFAQLTTWGIPYWLGRVYFSDREGALLLAKGIVIGGLLYAPLCWYEIRFSPQLHSEIYGFRAVPFYMIKRYGGFRPIVFTQSSLLVAMWMSASTVVCAWLAFTGTVKRVLGIPTRWAFAVLAVTTLFCKALGAITLMLGGVGLVFAARRLRTALPLVFVLAVVIGYPVARGTGVLDAPAISDLASAFYDEQRVSSLGVRLRSEDMYVEHAAERPILGWGGWGRGDVIGPEGRSVPDGLWVIALSRAGWIAVLALGGIYLLPAISLVRRFAVRKWTQADLVPGAALAHMLMLYWIDCLSNAMLNLVLLLAHGAASGFFARRQIVAPPAVPTVGASPEAPPAAVEPRPPSLARGLKQGRGSFRPPPS